MVRFPCKKSRRQKAAAANGRMTERVRAVRPRKKPESRRWDAVGCFDGLEQKEEGGEEQDEEGIFRAQAERVDEQHGVAGDHPGGDAGGPLPRPLRGAPLWGPWQGRGE